MQTIVIVLNPERLVNADADLRYRIPERVEEITDGAIGSNGYDYIDCEEGGPLMGIWLHAESAMTSYPAVVQLLQTEKFQDNDLSLSVEIYISENDTEDLENCVLVYQNGRYDDRIKKFSRPYRS